MSRSDRLSSTLLACSMTPRSGRKYLDDLAAAKTAVDTHNEILYSEAKWSLLEGDVDAARALLESCPSDYKQTARYAKQCAEYERLRHKGLILSSDSEVKDLLSDVLGLDRSSLVLARYADRLARGGYNRRCLEAVTLSTVDAACSVARFSQGHTHLFRLHAEAQTPAPERIVFRIALALERCGGVAKCIRASRRGDRDGEEEEEEEEDPSKEEKKERRSACCHDADETATAMDEEEETHGD